MEGKTKMTQCEKIIRHLRAFGSISSLEAINEYGILVGETKTGTNRFDEKTSYKVYRLVEEEGN